MSRMSWKKARYVASAAMKKVAIDITLPEIERGVSVQSKKLQVRLLETRQDMIGRAMKCS